MKLHALMNRLEDIGEARDVVVRNEQVNGIGERYIVEYDVVGAETDGLGNIDGYKVVLILRERPASD